MPVWPKSYYTLRASLLTVGMARWRRRRTSAGLEQQRVFQSLIRELARTSFWRESGVESGMSYEKFRTRVAPRTHDRLIPAFERMQRGEADVLWPGTCGLFADTAGTTTGRCRSVPATDAFLAHVRAAGFQAILHHTARVGHTGIFRGRHLLLGGATALRRVTEAPVPAFAGDASGIAMINLPPWAERHLCEPGPGIARIQDWEPRLEATAARALARDISLIAGLPQWTGQLAGVVIRRCTTTGRPCSDLRAVWPNLECYVHTGMPVAPFQDELRAYLGSGVSFHEIYAAAEGIIAAQEGEPAAGLRLLSDSGIFFEFVPAAEFDDDRPDQSAEKAVPISGVTTGVDYAVLLTTPAGLARYVLGDVVRFVSTEPPRLVPIGRTRLKLNAFGERITEKHVTDAMVAVCRRHQWTPVDFHVAPLPADSLTGRQNGRHEWWIELKPGTMATPTGPQIAAHLDADLLKASGEYATLRGNGTLAQPTVRLVMPGVFGHWLRFHGRWGGSHRTPRCRSDRLVADELAQITHFAKD